MPVIRISTGPRRLDEHTFGRLVDDLMGKTQREPELGAIELGPVADPTEIEEALVPLGHTGDQILDPGAGHPPHLPGPLGFTAGADGDPAFRMRDLDLLGKIEAQRALRSGHLNAVSRKSHPDSVRHHHRCPADS